MRWPGTDPLTHNNQLLSTPHFSLADVSAIAVTAGFSQTPRCEMGADYSWHGNRIFFSYMTREQFQIQGVEPMEINKNQTNVSIFVKILKTGSHLSVLVATLIAVN